MFTYDLCLAWNWEYDADFVKLLNTVCRAKNLALLKITPANIAQSLQLLSEQRIGFRTFFDRASEVDTRFIPLINWVRENRIYSINSHERAVRACDKALMHPDLIHGGLYVPYTIILPSYEVQPEISPVDLSPLGGDFTIKPAHGSGGDGVMIKATSWNQVVTMRREHPADKYLLQAHITPRKLDTRSAWFRVIYCTGKIYPCWWHGKHYVYAPVTKEEQDQYGLSPLNEAAEKIARISGLDLFSTEIAYTPEGLFVVVDYVNDPIDLRLRSKAIDGVPDDIVNDITSRIVDLVLAHL
ncbi:MAG: hypothetical protein JW956_10595 [Calditrichaceae bacterium]|nr:hypothetical protein [Calditrichaceae bacterium]